MNLGGFLMFLQRLNMIKMMFIHEYVQHCEPSPSVLASNMPAFWPAWISIWHNFCWKTLGQWYKEWLHGTSSCEPRLCYAWFCHMHNDHPWSTSIDIYCRCTYGSQTNIDKCAKCKAAFFCGLASVPLSRPFLDSWQQEICTLRALLIYMIQTYPTTPPLCKPYGKLQRTSNPCKIGRWLVCWSADQVASGRDFAWLSRFSVFTQEAGSEPNALCEHRESKAEKWARLGCKVFRFWTHCNSLAHKLPSICKSHLDGFTNFRPKYMSKLLWVQGSESFKIHLEQLLAIPFIYITMSSFRCPR